MLIVDAFARYRISDPVLFYQRVQNVLNGQCRRLNDASAILDIAFRGRPDQLRWHLCVTTVLGVVMENIRRDVSANAEELGIEVIDVKIRRADLPDANSQAIYARMQTERQQ